jgi:hypothetical protein
MKYGIFRQKCVATPPLFEKGSRLLHFEKIRQMRPSMPFYALDEGPFAPEIPPFVFA